MTDRTTLLTGPARDEAKQRLKIIAEQIDHLYAEETRIGRDLQRLRDEQARLNQMVYSA